MSEFPLGKNSLTNMPSFNIVTLRSDLILVTFVEDLQDNFLKTQHLITADEPYFGFDDPQNLKIWTSDAWVFMLGKKKNKLI